MYKTLVIEHNFGQPDAHYVVGRQSEDMAVMDALRAAAADFADTEQGKAVLSQTGGRMGLGDLDLHCPEHVLLRHGLTISGIDVLEITSGLDLLSDTASDMSVVSVTVPLSSRQRLQLAEVATDARPEGKFMVLSVDCGDCAVRASITQDPERPGLLLSDVNILNADGTARGDVKSVPTTVDGFETTFNGVRYDVRLRPDNLITRLGMAGVPMEISDGTVYVRVCDMGYKLIKQYFMDLDRAMPLPVRPPAFMKSSRYALKLSKVQEPV